MADATYLEKNRGSITFSKIKAFRHCQQLYKQQYLDEVVPAEENDAFVFGSAVDALVQGQDEFDKRFEVVARRMGKSEKEELNPSMARKAEACIQEFERQPLYARDGVKYQHEIIVPYRGYQLKGTLDKLDLGKREIRDVKTAASIATLENYFLL